MELVIDRFETRFQNVCVDLSGREVGVTKEALNGPQVGAAVKQVRCKRMPHNVRTQIVWKPGVPGMLFQDLPESNAAQPTTAHIHEEPRAIGSGQVRASVRRVSTNPFHRLTTDRDDALLRALSHANEIARLKVEVAWFDGDQFGHSHSGRIQQLDECAVAETAGCGRVWLIDQLVDLFDREKLGEARPCPRRAKVFRRVERDVRVTNQKSIEATDAGHGSCDRTRRQPFGSELPDECFEVCSLELPNPPSIFGREPDEGSQIALVAFDGIRRQTASASELVEVRIN